VKVTQGDKDDLRCEHTGKIMFTSQVAAERRASRVAQFGKGKRSDTCHSYECPYCGGWHIGRDKSRDFRFTRMRERGEL